MSFCSRTAVGLPLLASTRSNSSNATRRTKSLISKPAVIGDDKSKKPILGQDSVDWAAVLAACREFGGTEWITLEQEAYPDGKSPMQCTEESFAL